MPMPTAQQAAANWARGMSNATEKIRAGVQAVTESPTEKAAARADAYAQGVQRAVSEGKFQAGLRAVSTEAWKAATLNKGVTRIAGGATEAQPKFAQFMSNFLPHVQQGVQNLPPRGTTEQNIQRAVEMMRWNSKFSAAKQM